MSAIIRLKYVLFYIFPIFAYAGLIFYLSSWSRLPETFTPFWGADKILHILEYYLLGYLLFRAMIVSPHKALSSYAISMTLFIGILYGISDEWHQSMVPGRDASLGDVFFDCFGIIAAVLTFPCLRNRLSPLFFLESRFEEALKDEKRPSHHH